MEQPDTYAECFPEPHDDEPASLRQDIADELADHLASSLRRQLLATPDEDQARARVLDRFGNPHHVARQLWFDAMKEKIMSQRLNLVLSSLMAAVCLAALGLVIVVFRDSQALNAAMLEKLHALTAPAPASAPPPTAPASPAEWTHARFKLVLGRKGGPPAVGFNVQIQAGLNSQVVGETQKNGQVVYGIIEETTDADGIADLGMFRFGSYSLQVRAPWGEGLSRQIGLRPGEAAMREIVCPAAPPDEADVAFSVDWPEDLQAQKLWLLFSFATSPARQIGVDFWHTPAKTGYRFTPNGMGMGMMGGMGGGMWGGAMSANPGSEMLLVDSAGGITMRSVKNKTIQLPNPDQAAAIQVQEFAEFVAPTQFEESYRLPTLNHLIGTLVVVNPSAVENGSYLVLARYPKQAGMGGGMGGGFFNVLDDGKTPLVNEGAGLTFEPKSDVTNRWKITLSSEFLDQVRAAVNLKLPSKAGEAAD